MCNPAALVFIGGAMAAKGQVDKGQEEARTLHAQAGNEWALARDAEVRGSREAGAVRSAGTEAVSEAKMATSEGVRSDWGSALDVLEGIRLKSEGDVTTTRNNAMREVRMHRAQAKAYRAAADAAERGGVMAGFGTFMSSIGGAAGSK